MKPPIKETGDLLRASNNYLADPRPQTERAFYEALAALEAAEQAQTTLNLPHWGALLRRRASALGAAAILIVLIGLFAFYEAASPARFSGAPTPTLILSTPQVSLPTMAGLSSPAPGPCPEGMDYVPQGVFLMGAGAQDADAQPDERPQRQVSLDAFCIDHTETSNGQYAVFLTATNHTAPSGWNGSSYPPNINQNYKDLPVVNVSWFDARDYCTWLYKQLPTEAQWEKAARGTDGRIYPWGNSFDPAKANYGGTTPRELQTVDSNSSGQSPYGVLNMAGNAAEWTEDWYLADAYSRMPDLNPTGPTASATGNRVVRGGSYVTDVKSLRTTARVGIFKPTWTQPDIGFRCAAPPAK